MKKRLLLAAGLLFLVIGLFFIKEKKGNDHEVHFHAGFQVYSNDSLIDFTDFKYMNFIPCGAHDEEKPTPEQEQMERAHLHDFVDDVVHVHRTGATWGDLFKNINFEILPTEVYVNGELFQGDIFSYQIKAYDSIVIFQGESTNRKEKVEGRASKDHILEVEAKSEYCAS